jgi:exopolyphosphatase/guanosine-5'-triphosphate,3'-diphosphate pyrophosphatase
MNQAMFDKTVAIIDIGSNSVRLVVYAGSPRIPFIIFNEKVLAGLGEGLAKTGELTQQSQERALAALKRFSILTRQMEVTDYCTVATAAVRDASNGPQFLEQVRAAGFDPEMLSGDEEAARAGQGVLSAIPDAEGIVGDLGGGSLELVDVGGGEIRRTVSLPLGVLRIKPILAKGEAALAEIVQRAVAQAGFSEAARKRPFYLVGGTWRALARLDMQLVDYPLPIMHHYSMRRERPQELQSAIAALEGGKFKKTAALSVSRVPTLANGNLLLKHLVETLRPSHLIVSSFGIREGLLYNRLDEKTRARDPLIEAAREAGRGLGRFAEHGALLDRWIAPIFDDGPEAGRVRMAACLLADVAWQAHPDFRAERGVDMALHGNWVGIDGPGRVMMAQALFSNFGGRGDFSDEEVASLCTPDELKRAALWGLAMRLGQRLSGGVAAGLERSALGISGDRLRLKLKARYEALYGETVERRLKNLAVALGLKPEVAPL